MNVKEDFGEHLKLGGKGLQGGEGDSVAKIMLGVGLFRVDDTYDTYHSSIYKRHPT